MEWLPAASVTADAVADADTAAMLLRPFRIEDLDHESVDSFGTIADRDGQPWTAELVRTCLTIVGESYRPGAAGRALPCHLPRWHHQQRGIRCECPIHAAGTTWLGHPRRINGEGQRPPGRIASHHSHSDHSAHAQPRRRAPAGPGRSRGRPVTPTNATAGLPAHPDGDRRASHDAAGGLAPVGVTEGLLVELAGREPGELVG